MPERDIDRIDLKILEVLQGDGRITNQELAGRVALSPSACLARVRALEAAGLISGYHARVPVERIRPCMIMLGEVVMRRHNADDFRRFDALLESIPAVIEASRVSGPYDYLVKVVVSDIGAWREVVTLMLEERNGVEKVTSHVLMEDVKVFKGYPLQAAPIAPTVSVPRTASPK